QVLQIVIAVLVQPADLCMLLLPSQLAFLSLMVSAGTGYYSEPAIGPQLPLGTKPVRSLQNAQQLSRPNRSHRWNRTQPRPHLVLLAFHQQVSPALLGDRFSALRLAGSTAPPADALPVQQSLPTTPPDAAIHKPPYRYRGWPNCDRWPLLGSSPDSDPG